MLLMSSPALAVQGYVEEPQEGEAYYVVWVVMRCLDPDSGHRINPFDAPAGKQLRIGVGPFGNGNDAVDWADAAELTVGLGRPVNPVAVNVNPMIYLEDDAEVWTDPRDFGRKLKNFAESCAGDNVVN